MKAQGAKVVEKPGARRASGNDRSRLGAGTAPSMGLRPA